jgi:transcriptional regulator with XRE-family HTH domain
VSYHLEFSMQANNDIDFHKKSGNQAVLKKLFILLNELIEHCWKKAGFSQIELAHRIEVSKSQMIRYANKGVQPPADILNKLADVLNTSVDFLINGNTSEKAQATLKDTDLLQQFKAVDLMPDEDKQVIKKLIDAFITKGKLKQLAI